MRPALDPAPVAATAALLERLVANLVENAVRHNVDGGSVEVRRRAPRARSTVEVRNDGAAVPPDAVASAARAVPAPATAARRGDGVGLGLSIVRSVAEAHGGSVELRARPSGGLVARVSLPARDGASN